MAIDAGPTGPPGPGEVAALVVEGSLAVALWIRWTSGLAVWGVLLTAGVFGLLTALRGASLIAEGRCGCFGALSIRASISSRMIACGALALLSGGLLLLGTVRTAGGKAVP